MQMYESVGHNMKEIRKSRMPDIYSVKYTVGIINSYLPEAEKSQRDFTISGKMRNVHLLLCRLQLLPRLLICQKQD